MKNAELLEELLGLLKANGVKVRKDSLGGPGGGLCELKESRIFFVDTDSPSLLTARLCAEAISELIDIEAIYIKPYIREFIEENSGLDRGDN